MPKTDAQEPKIWLKGNVKALREDSCRTVHLQHAQRLPVFTFFMWPIYPGINFRDFFLQHFGVSPARRSKARSWPSERSDSIALLDAYFEVLRSDALTTWSMR